MSEFTLKFKPNAEGYLFTLNEPGAAAILKTMPAAAVRAIAHEVAAGAGDLVWVNEYTTDRAAASVTVPAGKQAKHGVLTRAASAAGLEVKAKSV